jgi:hypothetical protein
MAMRLSTIGLCGSLVLRLARPALCATAQTSAQPNGQSSNTSSSAAFAKARSLYYTPVDAGLQSFHCDVSFDWKDFMQKATNQPVPDDDTRLQYLRTIKLSVDDDLRAGIGELHWSAPTTAPNGTEEPIERMRSGIQQMWSGFFQSWNGFFNGEMISLGDNKTTAEKTSTGYYVFARENASIVEEQYDEHMVLQSLHVSTPDLDSIMRPTFVDSPNGKLITGMASTYKQPPTSPGSQVNMTVRYAPVGTFQLPSELVIEVPGTTSFDFHLSGCTVKTQITPK